MRGLTAEKKYEGVARLIEEHIARHDLRPGDRLAPEAELGVTLNVGRVTVRKGLELLRAKGLVESVPKKGSFVKRRPSPSLGAGLELMDEQAPVKSVFSVGGSKTLTLFSHEAGHPPWAAMWRELAALAEAELPGARVQVIPEAPARRGGVPDADVFTTAYPDLGELRRAGALRPLEGSLVERFFAVEDIFPLAWDFPAGDDLPAAPFGISASMRLWNEDLLARWCPGLLGSGSVQAMLADGRWRGQDFPPLVFFTQMLLYSLLEAGVDCYRPGWRHPRVRSREAREIIVCQLEMYNRCRSRWKSMDTPAMWEAFAQGALLGVNTFSYALAALPPGLPFKARCSCSPLALGGDAPAVAVYLAVSRNCAEPELAWDFIRLVCGCAGQEALARSRCDIPVLRQVARGPVYLDGCPEGMGELLPGLENKSSLLRDWPIFAPGFQIQVNRLMQRYYTGSLRLEGLCGALEALDVPERLLTGEPLVAAGDMSTSATKD